MSGGSKKSFSGSARLVGDIALAVAIQLLVCAAVKFSGFSAISDDDYARVVIAQQFVERPTLDPSGTSWLPLPFFVQGAFLYLFEPSLAVARAVAMVLSCGSSLLIYASARILGTPPRAAVWTSALGASLPYAAFLSVATVPEYPAACCLLFGACSLHPHAGTKARLAGAFCLFCACASRYESWPAALVVAGLHGRRAFREKGKLAAWLPAGLAGSFPAMWLVHGALHHSDPLFFVKRVVDYKEAFGHTAPSAGSLFLGYPRAFLLGEPEIVLAFVAASGLILMRRRADSKPNSERLVRALRSLAIPAAVLFVVLLALVVGALRGGAPTHHAERALLSLWLLCAVGVGHVIALSMGRQRLVLCATIAGGALLGHGARAVGAFDREAFVERTAEERLGAEIAARLPREERVALILPDYGYFAVMARGQHPGRFEVPMKHDPRSTDQETSLVSAARSWTEKGGCHYVAPREVALPTEVSLASVGHLALLRSARCSAVPAQN